MDIVSIAATPEAVIGIAPNPAQDVVTIHYKLPEMTNVALSLTDANGRQMWSKYVPDARFVSETVDTHALPTGIYFVKISPEGEQTTVQRLVIAR